MENNSILTVSSPFRFKTLFTKPLKYIIQIFTADATEHIATYSKGCVMNISGVGFRKMTFDDWMGLVVFWYLLLAILSLLSRTLDSFFESLRTRD